MKKKKLIYNPFVWLILLGIIARICGAVLFSSNYSGDHSVPCLMAKHIAEGKAMPVFYYGQPYMGSIEPIVSAVLYRLPFSPNLNCNLGTAFFGILLLPLVVWWAVRAGGRTAGLFALASVIIGPPVYVQFMSWAYGGYAATTFFITLSYLCGLEIIRREWRKPGQSSFWLWILVGLCIGAGWWTNPMIMIPIACLGLLGVVYLRTKCLQWKLVPALAAFGIGSLPFWIWNYQNNGAAVTFLFSKSANDVLGGVVRFLYSLTYALTDLGSDRAARIILAILCVLFVFSAVVWWKMRKKEEGLYLLSAWLLFFIAMIFFIRKPLALGPARYYLPLMPALAVILGVVLSYINRRFPWKTGYVVLLLITVFFAKYYFVCYTWYSGRNEYYAELEGMRPYFESLNTDVIYTEYFSQRKYGYGLNFYFNEAFCFTELPENERNPNYIRKGETNTNIAVLNAMFGLTEMLQTTGGSASNTIMFNGFTLQSNFQSPPIPDAMLTEGYGIYDEKIGQDVTWQLSDNNKRTRWRNSKQKKNTCLRIDFDKPEQVQRLRVVAEDKRWLENIRIDVLKAGAEDWNEGRTCFFTSWFWPDHAARPYANGVYYRQEVMIGEDDVQSLRLVMNSDVPETYIELSEVQIYQRLNPEADSHEKASAVEQLARVLVTNQTKRVYADRWTANLLRKEWGGDSDILLSLEPVVYPSEDDRLSPDISLEKPFAMIVRPENISLCEKACRVFNASYRIEDIGQWKVCFVTPVNSFGNKSVMEWKGYGPQIHVGSDTLRDWCSVAENRFENGKIKESKDIIEKILSVWPGYIPALKIQAELLEKQGDNDRVKSILKELNESQTPMIPFRLTFENGIELRGISYTFNKLKRGDVLELTYYWTVPEECNVNAYAVFLHIKDHNDKLVLSDDRVLFDDYMAVYHSFDDSYVSKRRIQIPETMSPGMYTFYTGLYLSNPPHDRIPVKTDLPEERNSVCLPFSIEVGE